MRSVAHRVRTAKLAVLARPAHRCLRRHHAALRRSAMKSKKRLDKKRARSSRAEAPALSPRELGFRMPAEWEPHAATWLAWPHEASDWPGKFGPVPWVFAELARNLCGAERVRIIVRDAAMQKAAKSALAQAGVDLTQIDFLRCATNRSWTRDFGA